MDSIQTLDPRDPRAKEALIGILGTTIAGLKEIDKSIVGGSNNVLAQKTDLRQFSNLFDQPHPQPQPVYHQPQPVAVQPLPAAAPIPVPEPTEDPNQLVFDFNKPITPNTINDKLDNIIEKLNVVIEKLKS